MFNLFKQLPNGEMALLSTHETLVLAESSAKLATLKNNCLVHIEGRSDGGSRIVAAFDMRPKAAE